MTKETLQQILAAHEDLSANGWKFRDIGEDRKESDARHAEARRRAFDGIEEFEHAREFLNRVTRRKSVWKGSTSYGWKHQAKHYFKANGHHQYISNGMFIAAAIALGFIVERIPGSPNCWLNISARESYTYNGGRFMNRRSGKWMTFAETYPSASRIS